MALLGLEDYRKNNAALDQLILQFPRWQLERLPIRRIKKGAALIREGQQDESLYLILEGVVDILHKVEGRDPLPCDKATVGDWIGLHELLGPPAHRVATVRAHTDLVALAIPRGIVLEWFYHAPELAMTVSNQVIARLFTINCLLAECSSYNLLRSTITYLLYVYHLYVRQHGPGYIGTVRIGESRQEIAAFLGADVRSINRAVEKLKNAGLITVLRGKIHMNQAQYQQLLQEKNSGEALA